MTQELDLRNGELTLGQADRQSVLSTKEQNLTEVIYMLLQAGAKH